MLGGCKEKAGRVIWFVPPALNCLFRFNQALTVAASSRLISAEASGAIPLPGQWNIS